MVGGMLLLEHDFSIEFLSDGLPTVKCSVQRHSDRVLRVERSDGVRRQEIYSATRYDALVSQHAIAYGTGQQFARGLADRFRSSGWSVVLLLAQNAAEGRLGP
jgi:hypothetical protein